MANCPVCVMASASTPWNSAPGSAVIVAPEAKASSAALRPAKKRATLGLPGLWRRHGPTRLAVQPAHERLDQVAHVRDQVDHARRLG